MRGIDRVDHIYVEIDDAQAVFDALTRRLGLPVGWPFRQVAEGFASGGISLGNLILELVSFGHPVEQSSFGVALSPAAGLAEARAVLAARGVDLGDGVEVRDENSVLMWTSAPVPALCASGLYTFVCDYVVDPRLREERCQAELAANEGGALGITGVSHIIVEAAEPIERAAVWTEVLGGGSQGPGVQVVPGDRDGLRAITIAVRDPEAASEAFERLVPEYVKANAIEWVFVSCD